MHVPHVVEPVRRLRRRRADSAARALADAELLGARLPSPRLAWRTAELTAPEHRLELARAASEAVHDADGRTLPGASPLRRAAAREARAQLLALASCLADLDRAVRPRGVLLAERLLTRADSPLFTERPDVTVRSAASEALAALEQGR